MTEPATTSAEGVEDAVAAATSPGGRRATLLGIGVSAVALAAVVWWILRQPAPEVPSAGEDLAALALAIGLYAVATCLRAERWRVLLRDQGANPARADMYGLTIVGFAANTVLPARGGDVVRVVMAAPRAATTWRTVLGTLLAERVLDVVVLATVLTVLGATVAGGAGLPEGRTFAIAAGVAGAALILAAVAVVVVVRRGHGERLRGFVAPMLASTVNLRGRHGAAMLAMSALIWAVEGCVWTAIAAAANLGFDALDGPYVLALVGMFLLVPSGPGYAGTVDAATILSVRAVGASAAGAVSFLVLMRFVVFVPITIVGLVIAVVRYGGLRRPQPAV